MEPTFLLEAAPIAPPPAIEIPKEFRMTSPGDCILRSSDGVDYKVFRGILALVSPVFQSMFELTQTPSATPRESDTADLPVISVSESSSTLSIMLLLVYPCRFFSFPNLKSVFRVIEAYDKYDIDTRSLQLGLREILVSDDTLMKNPLGAYAVAWILGMKDDAQNASRYLHTLDLNDKGVKQRFLEWADSGGWDALLALWDLRVRRAEALGGLIDTAKQNAACVGHINLLNQASIGPKAREALNTPNPSCIDLRSFLNLRQLVSRWGCVNCNNLLNTPRTEVEVNRDMSLISSFPQTIRWKDM